MTKQLLIFLLFIASFSYSATFTTTGVPGTWSPAGPPGANDDIVVNHDWSGYDAAQIANYTGTMTINSGGYYKMAGSFTNFTGTIDIQSGGTFEVTGSVDVAAGSSTNLDGSWVVAGDFDNNQSTDWTGTGSLAVTGTFDDISGTSITDSTTCTGCTMVLPIELVSFNVKTIGDLIHLEWVTGSEINNEIFYIEHSTDGKTFSIIGSLLGAGNSSIENYYSFIDNNASFSDFNYYRIKQVDFDGTYSYSPVQFLAPENTFDIIQVNTSNQIRFISDNLNEDIKVEVFNLSGKLVDNNHIGPNQTIEYFLKGVFLVRAYQGNQIITKKISLQ
jgi:hypothetical protein